jgi:hypothetical protein
MKSIFLVVILVACNTSQLQAQMKQKQKSTEAAPTAKEMEEMMRQAQQEMDNLDPETKKMMDSMGVKLPSLNNIPKVTDAELQQAFDDENRIVPQKDVSRIASISKTSLSNATLGAFVSSTHDKVVTRLKPSAKATGEEIYKAIKSQYNSSAATGNTAASLFMIGKFEIALYVMGKACIDGPTNTDNLNNYASMLSMSGAEQLSVPLLNYLNRRYPKNSTVLNNLGQAWFGLGEIDKANSYLDSAIRLCAYHPQANYTKSFIEESKDHSTAAVDAAKKSIRKSYAMKKEERLNKLGYKLKDKDLIWDKPMPADALGLEKFKWPRYPMNVLESEALEKEWNAFKATCNQEITALESQQKKLEQDMVAINQKRTQHLISSSQKGLWVDPVPRSAPKAFIKLKYLIDGKDGQLAHAYQQKTEKLSNAYLAAGTMEGKLRMDLNNLEKKYEDAFGEGKANPFEAVCKEENNLKNAFLTRANGDLEQASNDYLNFLRRKINDETYYNQYTMWPEQFELAKVHAKLSWLISIRGQKVMFQNKSSLCQQKSNEKEKPFKLAAFDDVHCDYHSELRTPVGTIRTDCSRMTTTLDLKVVKLGLKQDMDKETFGDQFMTCSVEVGVGASAGINQGPLKAEASIGGSLAAEFDRNGLTDLVVKTSAGVSAGTDIISGGSMAGVGVSDLSLEIGVQGQISLISGLSSAGSTGLLSGVFTK